MITSLSNNLIKLAAALNQKKYRQEYGLFLLEGFRSVSDAYFYDPQAVVQVFMTEAFFASKQAKKLIDAIGNPPLSKPQIFNPSITNQQTEQSEKMVLVSDAVMKKITDTVTPSGIAAIAKIPKEGSDLGDYILYLDRINDPGNLGSIIRTALAAGYGVVLHDCADLFSPKTVRSSISAVLKIKYAMANDIIFSYLKAGGFTVMAADMGGENLFDAAVSAPLCLVVGNEAEGVSAKVLKKCDKILSIPMQSMESLNASAAAAIMMYKLRYSK